VLSIKVSGVIINSMDKVLLFGLAVRGGVVSGAMGSEFLTDGFCLPLVDLKVGKPLLYSV